MLEMQDACLVSTISYKTFGANSSSLLKQRTAGRVGSPFFGTFLLVLTKFLFWQGDWALGYHSMGFRHFPDIS